MKKKITKKSRHGHGRRNYDKGGSCPIFFVLDLPLFSSIFFVLDLPLFSFDLYPYLKASF